MVSRYLCSQSGVHSLPGSSRRYEKHITSGCSVQLARYTCFCHRTVVPAAALHFSSCYCLRNLLGSQERSSGITRKATLNTRGVPRWRLLRNCSQPKRKDPINICLCLIDFRQRCPGRPGSYGVHGSPYMLERFRETWSTLQLCRVTGGSAFHFWWFCASQPPSACGSMQSLPRPGPEAEEPRSPDTKASTEESDLSLPEGRPAQGLLDCKANLYLWLQLLNRFIVNGWFDS